MLITPPVIVQPIRETKQVEVVTDGNIITVLPSVPVQRASTMIGKTLTLADGRQLFIPYTAKESIANANVYASQHVSSIPNARFTCSESYSFIRNAYDFTDLRAPSPSMLPMYQMTYYKPYLPQHPYDQLTSYQYSNAPGQPLEWSQTLTLYVPTPSTLGRFAYIRVIPPYSVYNEGKFFMNNQVIGVSNGSYGYAYVTCSPIGI